MTLTVEQARQAVVEGMAQRAADLAAGRPPTFTLDSLHAIAADVPVDLPPTPDGAPRTFVFYSGGYVGEFGEIGSVSARNAALSLRDQAPDRVALIDDTPIGRFLADIGDPNNTVARALEDLVGAENVRFALSGGGEPGPLYDRAGSLFGRASDRFAATAQGDVIVLASRGSTPDGGASGIWRDVEFPGELHNQNVETINGLRRDVLLGINFDPDRGPSAAINEIEFANDRNLAASGHDVHVGSDGRMSFGDRFFDGYEIDRNIFQPNALIEPVDVSTRYPEVSLRAQVALVDGLINRADLAILLVAAPVAWTLLSNYAQANGRDPHNLEDLYQTFTDLGGQVTREQFISFASGVGAELSLSLTPIGAARRIAGLLMSGESALDVIKLYELAYPDDPTIRAMADAAQKVEGTDAWQLYKAGVGAIEGVVRTVISFLASPSQAVPGLRNSEDVVGVRQAEDGSTVFEVVDRITGQHTEIWTSFDPIFANQVLLERRTFFPSSGYVTTSWPELDENGVPTGNVEVGFTWQSGGVWLNADVMAGLFPDIAGYAIDPLHTIIGGLDTLTLQWLDPDQNPAFTFNLNSDVQSGSPISWSTTGFGSLLMSR